MISVLTPSFNYGRFIGDCVASVAGQGLAVEHIVQDGGSSDDTTAILGAHPEVQWRSEPDRGQSDALNRALATASGEWIGWLNADEFYLPGGLQALLARASSSDADIVFGDAVFVDESGRFMRLVTQHPFRAFFLKYYGCFISSCAVLLRREALGSEPWDESFRMAMDWELYLRMVERGARAEYVGFPVGAFRMHGEQVIARSHEFAHEHDALKERYGIGGDRVRRLGRWPHDGYKLLTGGYPRQMKANKRLPGKTLRWFGSDEGVASCEELLACYRPASASKSVSPEDGFGSP